MPRCKGTTQDKMKCSRLADSGSLYCFQHKKKHSPKTRSSPKRSVKRRSVKRRSVNKYLIPQYQSPAQNLSAPKTNYAVPVQGPAQQNSNFPSATQENCPARNYRTGFACDKKALVNIHPDRNSGCTSYANSLMSEYGSRCMNK